MHSVILVSIEPDRSNEDGNWISDFPIPRTVQDIYQLLPLILSKKEMAPFDLVTTVRDRDHLMQTFVLIRHSRSSRQCSSCPAIWCQ